jgi:hypothetical protein
MIFGLVTFAEFKLHFTILHNEECYSCIRTSLSYCDTKVIATTILAYTNSQGIVLYYACIK